MCKRKIEDILETSTKSWEVDHLKCTMKKVQQKNHKGKLIPNCSTIICHLCKGLHKHRLIVMKGKEG